MELERRLKAKKEAEEQAASSPPPPPKPTVRAILLIEPGFPECLRLSAAVSFSHTLFSLSAERRYGRLHGARTEAQGQKGKRR